MITNQGYIIIKFDHEDDTVLIQDKQLMALIGKDKKHWITANSPYLWVRLIGFTKEPYKVGGCLFGQLSHTVKDSWYKGIPTLTVEYYDEFDEEE
jgi:hypothetical protein